MCSGREAGSLQRQGLHISAAFTPPYGLSIVASVFRKREGGSAAASSGPVWSWDLPSFSKHLVGKHARPCCWRALSVQGQGGVNVAVGCRRATGSSRAPVSFCFCWHCAAFLPPLFPLCPPCVMRRWVVGVTETGSLKAGVPDVAHGHVPAPPASVSASGGVVMADLPPQPPLPCRPLLCAVRRGALREPSVPGAAPPRCGRLGSERCGAHRESAESRAPQRCPWQGALKDPEAA